MAIKEPRRTWIGRSVHTAGEPFDPNQIKWRVTHTTQDGSRGASLHTLIRERTRTVSPAVHSTGWTRATRSPRYRPSRHEEDKLIQTGKVLVTCTLTITGLGCHAGSGEDWADESNAMTTAEAQAFKRAASVMAWGVTFHLARCGSAQ